MTFREWLHLCEGIAANFDNWLASLRKNNPDNPTLHDWDVNPPARQNIIAVLQGPLDKQKFFDLAIGMYLVKPSFRTEDLKRLIDAVQSLSSQGRKPKNYLQAGMEWDEWVLEYEALNVTVSSSKSLKLKQQGIALPEDERLYKLINHETVNGIDYKLYDIPPIHNNKDVEARHRVLCKLGKGTNWCTASPSGDYHQNYKSTHIRVVYKNDRPAYQYDLEGEQFMDEKDEEGSMDYNTFLFLNQIGDGPIINKHVGDAVYQSYKSDKELIRFLNIMGKDLDLEKAGYLIYREWKSDEGLMQFVQFMGKKLKPKYWNNVLEKAKDAVPFANLFLDYQKEENRYFVSFINPALYYTQVDPQILERILGILNDSTPVSERLVGLVLMSIMHFKFELFDEVIHRLLKINNIKYTPEQYSIFKPIYMKSPGSGINYALEKAGIDGFPKSYGRTVDMPNWWEISEDEY